MITVIKPGLLSTIQDKGRFKGSHLGVPVSGVMDAQSADLANLLIGNDSNDAVLECTYDAPVLRFDAPTVIAIAGARLNVYKNAKEIGSDRPIQLSKGDEISFSRFSLGCRLYIAIKGGFKSESIMGSRSVCYTAGILNPLKRGDLLSFTPFAKPIENYLSLHRRLGNTEIIAYEGPEYAILKDMLKTLSLSNFKILPRSNRMAYRVSHTLDLSHSLSILSSGTLPGSVQLTPAGELIFLMRDCQTTGGYPRILQLSEQSICDLSQLRPGTEFTIQLES